MQGLGRQLYYITHIDNIASILERGILSHYNMEKMEIDYTPIYDREIVLSRQAIKINGDKSLWFFANLYFQPRNAMLYKVISDRSYEEIAIFGINLTILNRNDVYITDGNAASLSTVIWPIKEGKKFIATIRECVNKEWWAISDDSKRQLMAECLVPEKVDLNYISTIYVATESIRDKLKMKIGDALPIVCEPSTFFMSPWEKKITPSLSLFRGDMFFSNMQTLTISVNCKGVMGKGLASRAKYQFPDVYVYYQDLCRQHKLRLGNPCLYKREESFDATLADHPQSLKNGNREKWFLLFATKDHWKFPAKTEGIEQGLRWVQENYKKEKIKSLAVPALGCGLGKLNWRDIGPLMVNYLSDLDIPVEIYLPAEKSIPREMLTKEFLISRKIF